MEAADRLSALPNGILCHILSFLPTHDAIATTLLSKRWQLLWHSVPVLDLDDQTFLRNSRPYSSFFGFVYAAIFTRSPHPPLTRFRLNSCARKNDNDLPNSHFKIWLNAVVQCGLEHLHIELNPGLELPSRVFSCITLVVLKLSRMYLSVDPLGSVHLPALKTLHLDHFVVTATTQFFAELLRECPVLQDLRANNMCFTSTILEPNKSDGVEFQSMPKLLRADICDNYDFEFPLKAVCNVEYLRVLLEVKVDQDHRYVLCNQECFPVFHNLIHLELIFWSSIKWDSVFEMLNHCPKLQTFLLHRMYELSSPEIWYCPQSVPECIYSQLRKCTILNYNGMECELLFAKYIMQNSRALRTFTIHSVLDSTFSSYPRDKLEMLQELTMCPRSSATCELLFK